MELTSTVAEKLALDFFLEDWEIPEDDRDFFVPLDSRVVDDSWYVVEIGVEGLPDQWVIQVYDETKECDPCFTFVTPIKASESETGLEEMPESIAEILRSERQSQLVISR
ncbi:hypothetical protein Xen7305DRAFT_00005150 [Xenococcus sp. PCC 7305]|uniref:hypothetical protein n=1 Tax=Xenococcus sp. PCC 7305 TaxID=102125 RepID=UPI0002ABA418|nr:hypothetical protein [Xenococcus sp. PCC 7305]ELS00814.1 hypothetical protein Xen7305DRAFT_00005150 [Xenococcus sp. PCC 7305]